MKLIHAATWMNSENIYAKWDKPDMKGLILYDFTYCTILPRVVKFIDRKVQ